MSINFAPENCVGPTSELAGKSESCGGCPNQQLCRSGEAKAMLEQNDSAVKEVRARLQSVKHKVLILSGKGGVGKSTVTTQLAWLLSSLGATVGVCDVDICGPSIPHMLGVANHDVHPSSLGWEPVAANEHLSVMSVAFLLDSPNDAVIWRGPRKNGLIKQFLGEVNWGELDFLFIDSPPGTSDEHLAVNTYLSQCAIDGALVVTTPQAISLLDVRKEITFCHRTKIPVLGLVENMAGFVCNSCGERSRLYAPTVDSVHRVSQELSAPVMGNIPLDPDLMASCDLGEPCHLKFPTAPCIPYLCQLVKELLNCSPELRATAEQLDLNSALDEMLEIYHQQTAQQAAQRALDQAAASHILCHQPTQQQPAANNGAMEDA